MNETKPVETTQTNTDIPNEVISRIELEIAQLDQAEKAKLMAQLNTSHKAELNKAKETYEAKLKEITAQLEGKTAEKDAVENKFENYAKQLDSKLEVLFKELKGTSKPVTERQGITNATQNPFKEENPKDVATALKDPREWSKNEELRKRAYEDVKQMLRM